MCTTSTFKKRGSQQLQLNYFLTQLPQPQGWHQAALAMLLEVRAPAVFFSRLLGHLPLAPRTNVDKNINKLKLIENAITPIKLGDLKNTWGRRAQLQRKKKNQKKPTKKTHKQKQTNPKLKMCFIKHAEVH